MWAETLNPRVRAVCACGFCGFSSSSFVIHACATKVVAVVAVAAVAVVGSLSSFFSITFMVARVCEWERTLRSFLYSLLWHKIVSIEICEFSSLAYAP